MFSKNNFLKVAAISLCLTAPFVQADAGKDAFLRCSACHLNEGQGIPGAFPPIKGRIAKIANTEDGRAYLVAVVNAGLMGQITVAGQTYFGAMPAQGASYDAQGISDVLNYTIQVLDKDNMPADWQAYDADEVSTLLGKDAPANGQAVAKMRKALDAAHPGLL